MKEVKRVLTAKITIIKNVEEHKIATEEGKRDVAREIRDKFGFDDVVIEEVQDFVREVEE